MSVRNVAEFAALFEIAIKGIEHTYYCMTAQAENVFNLSALKVINYKISYKLFAHAG